MTTKADMLPPNFIFSSENRYYYGPATCELLHYRFAAPVAALVELLVQAASVAVALYLHHELKSLEYFVVLFLASFLAVSTVATVLMVIGLFVENADLVKPKLILQQIQIAFLLALAALSIVAMCFGIETTNNLFGVFLSVKEMERDFGPIWPFNISVLAFMAAALGVWMRIVSGGAYDFLLDKAHFTAIGNPVPLQHSKKRSD